MSRAPLTFEQKLARWTEAGAPWRAHTTEARRWLAERTNWPTPCPRCGQDVHPNNWHLGHIKDQATHPQLRWNPGNWRIEHPRCNTSAGAIAGNRNRKANKQNSVSSRRMRLTPPSNTKENPLENRESPGMPPTHPDGFPMPRFLPDLPPGADLSLADECEAWIRDRFGDELMPWQRLVLRYSLARMNNRLLFTRVVLRVARQQGKTFLARRLLAWRLLEGERVFGQPQRVINTHPDGTQATRLLEPVARRFGYQRGGLDGFHKQTFAASWHPGGQPSETEAAWYARAMTTNALTGNQGITFAYVDELQDAKEQVVSEALGGSLSGARVAARQRWFTGTGEKPGSELLRRLRRARGSAGMCWIEWSAPPGTPVDDRAGWRWGSPDWSEGRQDYLAEQLTELGPSEFAANYLLSDEVLTGGPALVDARVWGLLTAGAAPQWTVAAVEAAPFAPPVVVLAGRQSEDGPAVVWARSAVDLGQAADWCSGVQLVLVGKSLLSDPVWAALPTEKRQGTDVDAVVELRRLVGEGLLRHVDSGPLTSEVLSTHVLDSSVAGAWRLDRRYLAAVKAAVWASQAARVHEPWFVY